ncbi:MAG: DUF362 domain-containing protein [Deltaproteobacteria bacterium]|nr:DUF362 domain-containing protein [Deltaproteobacteria bacterium]
MDIKKITRRDLLKLGVGTTATLGFNSFLVGCRGDSDRERPDAIDGGLEDSRMSDAYAEDASQPAATVATIKGNDLDAMTRDALEALGGVGRIVMEGDTVFIKPNMIALPSASVYDGFGSGECTKPEILLAVAEECLKAGARDVIIGDASQRKTFDWRYAHTLDRSTNLVDQAQRLGSRYSGKIRFACLGEDSQQLVDIPTSTSLGTISIASLVAHADRIISVPVAKTHIVAQLSLSLKNFVGVTALGKYASTIPIQAADGGEALWRTPAFDHSSPEAIAAIYLDVVEALKPDLAIIDASIGVEGNGPAITSGGTTVNMKDRLGSWLLIASTDLVAADATAARVMSHDPADIKQIGMASHRGLGVMNSERIEIVGERLKDITVPWKKATLTSL